MSMSVRVVKSVNSLFRGRLTLLQQITDVYKTPINVPITRSRDKLIEIIKERAESALKSELARKIKVLKGFYTLEMAPPTTQMEVQKLINDIKLAQDFFKTGAMMHLTVKQAWLLFLVGLEVFLWFFIGESIGKGRLVGYSV